LFWTAPSPWWSAGLAPAGYRPAHPMMYHDPVPHAFYQCVPPPAPLRLSSAEPNQPASTAKRGASPPPVPPAKTAERLGGVWSAPTSRGPRPGLFPIYLSIPSPENTCCFPCSTESRGRTEVGRPPHLASNSVQSASLAWGPPGRLTYCQPSPDAPVHWFRADGPVWGLWGSPRVLMKGKGLGHAHAVPTMARLS